MAVPAHTVLVCSMTTNDVPTYPPTNPGDPSDPSTPPTNPGGPVEPC